MAGGDLQQWLEEKLSGGGLASDSADLESKGGGFCYWNAIEREKKWGDMKWRTGAASGTMAMVLGEQWLGHPWRAGSRGIGL